MKLVCSMSVLSLVLLGVGNCDADVNMYGIDRQTEREIGRQPVIGVTGATTRHQSAALRLRVAIVSTGSSTDRQTDTEREWSVGVHQRTHSPPSYLMANRFPHLHSSTQLPPTHQATHHASYSLSSTPYSMHALLHLFR